MWNIFMRVSEDRVRAHFESLKRYALSADRGKTLPPFVYFFSRNVHELFSAPQNLFRRDTARLAAQIARCEIEGLFDDTFAASHPMARLNEAPQPAPESIDALKRRFLRQNREIAKSNSTQALRIRSLEIEVSRLLGENLALREQIIKLQLEIESNKSQLGSSQVDSFRTKLDAKLREAQDLVNELGQAQQDAKKKGQQKRKSLSSTSPARRSPNQRIWKNTQTLSDLVGEAEGRLPPILEDKYYPRQTLNSDELQKSSPDPTNLTDSPDLGPPPVAHFEEGDPIKFDTQNRRRASKDNFPTTESSDTPLPSNLETRRRRRESSHSREALSKIVNPEPAKYVNTMQSIGESSHTVKIGAKRKLNARDEDERPVKEAEKDDFEFERKDVAKPAEGRSSKTTNSKGLDRPLSRTDRIRDASKETAPGTSSTSRRALGSKSTNIDPQSPAKAKFVAANVKPIPSRETLVQKIREKDQQRERPGTKMPVELARPTVQTVKTKVPDVVTPHEPETPAPPSLDLFSPTSTEPSARQEGRGDTPPPPDLGPDTGTGSYGRASRRSRGSVSYVEPSLRDKMRRPTKELVDAVGAEERAKQARDMRMNSNLSALAGIKVEDDSTEPLPNWKTVPVGESHAQKERLKAETTSPLGKKKAVLVSSTDLPTSVITERKRRASTMTATTITREGENDDTIEPAKAQSSDIARSTIAALAKPKRGQRQEDPLDRQRGGGGGGGEEDENGTAQRQRERDRTSSIFDFTGSSSSPECNGNGNNNKKKTMTSIDPEEETKPISFSRSRSRSTSRRHSSVPAAQSDDVLLGPRASSSSSLSSLTISRRTGGGGGRRESVL